MRARGSVRGPNAGGGTRTPTLFRAPGPKPGLSTSSSTPARPGQSGQTQGIVAAMAETVLVHPNRDKAEAKATRVIVILLLLVSAALILIVTIGGWSALQGAQVISFALAAIYLLMAFYVGRWNRGVLPVSAGLAVLFSVIAAVAGPARFDRD